MWERRWGLTAEFGKLPQIQSRSGRRCYCYKSDIVASRTGVGPHTCASQGFFQLQCKKCWWHANSWPRKWSYCKLLMHIAQLVRCRHQGFALVLINTVFSPFLIILLSYFWFWSGLLCLCTIAQLWLDNCCLGEGFGKQSVTLCTTEMSALNSLQ